MICFPSVCKQTNFQPSGKCVNKDCCKFKIWALRFSVNFSVLTPFLLQCHGSIFIPSFSFYVVVILFPFSFCTGWCSHSPIGCIPPPMSIMASPFRCLQSVFKTETVSPSPRHSFSFFFFLFLQVIQVGFVVCGGCSSSV